MAFIPDAAVLAQSEISPKAYGLFTYYCLRSGMHKPFCYVSLERAANDLKLDYSYTSRKRAELIKSGWIEIKGETIYLLKGRHIDCSFCEDSLRKQQSKFAKTANKSC